MEECEDGHKKTGDEIELIKRILRPRDRKGPR
jgi:hypothetical protein